MRHFIEVLFVFPMINMIKTVLITFCKHTCTTFVMPVSNHVVSNFNYEELVYDYRVCKSRCKLLKMRYIATFLIVYL